MTDLSDDPGFKKFLRNLGKRITQLRKEKQLTPDELAKQSGLSTSQLVKIEAGEID